MRPNTLIIRTAGTNCDRELAHAFSLAGCETQTVHLNKLIDDPTIIDRARIIGFPGGFSYGDDIAAGRILANRLRHRLFEPLQNAVNRGVPMIGICNGFQVLVKLGLLPFGDGKQVTTLADNRDARFIDRWVNVVVPDETVCVWTRGLEDFRLPIAHGEGRFVCDSDETLAALRTSGQIALRYASDDNPNGSADDIAGVCDPSGLVFGLMPHPERCVHPTHYPDWSRLAAGELSATPMGLKIFENAVAAVTQAACA